LGLVFLMLLSSMALVVVRGRGLCPNVEHSPRSFCRMTRRKSGGCG
jgi:hypothetical protein